MPVRTQKIQIPLGGIDTESDKRLVRPGSLLEADNAEFDEGGAITKRNGTTSVGTYGGNNRGITAMGDFIVSNTSPINMYSPTTGVFNYGIQNAEFPRYEQCKVTRIGCGKFSRADSWQVKAAYDGTYIYVVWFEQDAATPTKVYLVGQIIDATTGRALGAPRNVSTFNHSSGITAIGEKAYLDVTAYNGKAYAVAMVQTVSTPTSVVRLIEISHNATTGIGGVQRVNYSASSVPEKVSITNDGTNLLLYAKLDATTASAPLHTRTVASPGSLVSSVSPSGVTGPADVVHIFGDNGYFFCADGANYVIYQTDLSTVADSGATPGATHDSLFSMGEDGTNELVVGAVKNGNALVALGFNSSGTTSTITPQVNATTDAFIDNPLAGFRFDDGRFLVAGVENRSSTARGVYMTSFDDLNSGSDADGLRGVGCFTYGESDFKRINGSTSDPIAAPIVIDADTKFAFGGTFAIADDPLADNPNNLTYSACVYIVERVQRPKVEEFAGGYVMGPGFLSFTDQRGVFGQLGFAEQLKCEFDAESTSGGNLNNGSTYQVALMYERIDGNGRVHRSAPSAILSRTITGAGSSNSFTVEFCNAAEASNGAAYHAMVTADRDNTYLVAYRSLENGTVLYRESEAEITGTGTTITIGTETEANLASAEQLYTTGGVVETMPPPPCVDFVRAGRRLFALSSEYPERCYFTQEEQQGVGPEFSPFLYQNVDTGNGAPTAISELDGRIIVFYDRAIATFGGFGPDRRGVGSFSEVSELPADVGCVNPESVVRTPMGLVFKSHKGIMLLDRSLQVSYVGAPVEDYNSSAVLRAVSHQDDNKVVFLLDDGVTLLVWRYESNQWSTYTTAYSGGWRDIAELNGSLYALTTNGTYLLKEDSTVKEDATVAYNLKVTTPWISTAGLQGFQRVKWVQLVGDYEGAHTIQVKTYYDYDDSTAVETLTKAVSSDPNDYDIRFKPSRQKCKAIKLEITDVTPDSDGKSFKLSGIELEIGVKGGVSRNGPAPSAT